MVYTHDFNTTISRNLNKAPLNKPTSNLQLRSIDLIITNYKEAHEASIALYCTLFEKDKSPHPFHRTISTKLFVQTIDIPQDFEVVVTHVKFEFSAVSKIELIGTITVG